MKQVGGVWLPDEEQHLIAWMQKVNYKVDGKLTYQYNKLQTALRYVQKWRVAVDVGAHCGLWSMHLANSFIGVKAFEPRKEHADCFAHNVHSKSVEFFRCALGAQQGHARLHNGVNSSGDAYITLDGAGDVAVRTLDSFGFFGVDFLKIDVEGFEMFVVEGAKETILRDHPVIVVEQKHAVRYGLPQKAAVALLHSWGAKTACEISGDYILVW